MSPTKLHVAVVLKSTGKVYAFRPKQAVFMHEHVGFLFDILKMISIKLG